MGRVAATYRVLPEDASADVAALEKSVRTVLGEKVRNVAVRPIAFGLRALDVMVVVDDAAGEAERVEEKLRNLIGVGEVETLEVSLL